MYGLLFQLQIVPIKLLLHSQTALPANSSLICKSGFSAICGYICAIYMVLPQLQIVSTKLLLQLAAAYSVNLLLGAICGAICAIYRVLSLL